MQIKSSSFEPKRLREINRELEKLEYRVVRREPRGAKRDSFFKRLKRFLSRKIF